MMNVICLSQGNARGRYAFARNDFIQQELVRKTPISWETWLADMDGLSRHGGYHIGIYIRYIPKKYQIYTKYIPNGNPNKEVLPRWFYAWGPGVPNFELSWPS
jgi:hypothetical protein